MFSLPFPITRRTCKISVVVMH